MTSPAHSALTSSLVASARACADRICDVWMDDGGACPPKASVKQTFGPLSACRHTQPSITQEMHRRCSVVGPPARSASAQPSACGTRPRAPPASAATSPAAPAHALKKGACAVVPAARGHSSPCLHYGCKAQHSACTAHRSQPCTLPRSAFYRLSKDSTSARRQTLRQPQRGARLADPDPVCKHAGRQVCGRGLRLALRWRAAPRARVAAPGQHAVVRVIPGQQRGAHLATAAAVG